MLAEYGVTVNVFADDHERVPREVGRQGGCTWMGSCSACRSCVLLTAAMKREYIYRYGRD